MFPLLPSQEGDSQDFKKGTVAFSAFAFSAFSFPPPEGRSPLCLGRD